MKVFTLILCLFPAICFAVDNPDAPDYLGDFRKRIAPLEKYINENAETTADFRVGYQNLEKALEKELDSALQKLTGELETYDKEQLQLSQRQWEKFRDGEFIFISNNFDNIRFGSSATLSRGAYRTSILKDRIIQLLKYLLNY